MRLSAHRPFTIWDWTNNLTPPSPTCVLLCLAGHTSPYSNFATTWIVLALPRLLVGWRRQTADCKQSVLSPCHQLLRSRLCFVAHAHVHYSHHSNSPHSISHGAMAVKMRWPNCWPEIS